MRDLKFATLSDLDDLKKAAILTPEEQAFWDDMQKRLLAMSWVPDFNAAIAHLKDKGYIPDRVKPCQFFKDPQSLSYLVLESQKIAEQGYHAYIDSYQCELPAVDGQFDGRIALPRQIKYKMGYLSEQAGTYIALKPSDMASLLVDAVMFCQLADEDVGMYTGFAIRQSEAAGVAAICRRHIGMNDETTEWLEQRAAYLLNGCLLGAGFDPENSLQIGKFPSELLGRVLQICDGGVKAYRTKPDSSPSDN